MSDYFKDRAKKADMILRKIESGEYTLLKPNEVTNRVEKIRNVVTRDTLNTLTASFIMGMFDKYNFGTRKVKNVLKKVNEIFLDIEKGYLTTNDIMEWCDDWGFDYKSIFGKEEK